MSKIKADRSKSVLPFLIPSMILMLSALVVFRRPLEKLVTRKNENGGKQS